VKSFVVSEEVTGMPINLCMSLSKCEPIQLRPGLINNYNN